MYKAILREETFGGTYFCFLSNQRYYFDKEETKNIVKSGIFPNDIKEESVVPKEEIKFIPIGEKEKPVKFTFSDVAFIEVTRECNLRCIHCLNNSGIKDPNELTKEETEELIKKLAFSGVSEIRFTGGEPLLNKNIYDYIKLCTDLGVSTSLGTNGTLVTKTIAEKLVKAGLKRCVISLDGTKEKHDMIRGKGNFDRSLKAITLLKEKNVDVRANSVIMKNNIDDVIKLAKFLHSKKIKLYIRRFIESGRGKNLIDNNLSLKDYDYVRKELENELKDKYIDGHYLKSSEVTKKFRIDIPFPVTGCRAGERSFCITPNGNIYPCGFLAAQGYSEVANVRDVKDFRKFWNQLQKNKELSSLRGNMIKLNDNKITCMSYLYSMSK